MKFFNENLIFKTFIIRNLGRSQVQLVNEWQLSVAETILINIQDDDVGKTVLVSWTHQV